MSNKLRSLSYVILFVSLSAVTALGIIGFLNNAYAINANTSDSMKVGSNMTTTGNMTNTNTSGNMTKNMNTTGTTPVTTPKVLSPLQQFKSGTPAKSVQCVQGFTLVIKMEDGSPACVTSQNAQALTARGWGTTP